MPSQRKRLRYRVGFKDGSGKECVVDTRAKGGSKIVAVTAWGCSCCKPETSELHQEKAQQICDALNGAPKNG